jgi:hypothetical protein
VSRCRYFTTTNWICRVPIELEALSSNGMIRSEPDVNLMMSGGKESIAETLVTTKSANYTSAGILTVVHLNPIKATVVGRLQMEATKRDVKHFAR